MPNCDLLERTHELLLANPLTTMEVARDAKLPLAWLYAFRARKIKDPGVRRISILYEFLSASKIKV